MADLVTIIDTREQNSLPFSLPIEQGTLATGDYSVKGQRWTPKIGQV